VNIEYETLEGVATLIVAGDLDMSSAPKLGDLAELALSETVGTLRIDLAGVDFVDSTGLSALLVIKKKADAGRQTLILERPSERVRHLFEVAGLTKHFQIK
jgi:anti-sigma B factor antagonist